MLSKQVRTYVFQDYEQGKRRIAEFKRMIADFKEHGLIDTHAKHFSDISETGLLRTLISPSTHKGFYEVFESIKDLYDKELIPLSGLDRWIEEQERPEQPEPPEDGYKRSKIGF